MIDLKDRPIVSFTEHWDEYFRYFRPEERDTYFTEQYVKLYESEVARAESFVYREGEDVFLFPYLKKPVDVLGGQFYDLETAYGYGGPLSNSADAGFLERAVEAFDGYARERKIIAGMVRFHPLIGNHPLFKDRYTVTFDRFTVSMDLTLSQKEIWEKEVHSKHRNVIVKANKLGLTYHADGTLEGLGCFIKIYRSTMERLSADSFYTFNDDYFDGLKKLGDAVFLASVYLGREMIAGAIILTYGKFGHYHLAGTADGYAGYNPSNYLVYNTALYLKGRGIEKFHLGGGSTRDPENSLFRFKARFSRNRLPFFIGRMIIQREMYDKACSVWEESRRDSRGLYKNYVLKYRYVS